MASEHQITEKYGATHHIQKQRMVGEIDLSYLTKHESVAMGDGETFFWLLTDKKVAKSNLICADVVDSLPLAEKKISVQDPIVDFARRVARVMKEQRSSTIIFIMQQAFPDDVEGLDQLSTDDILDNIITLTGQQ